LNFGRAFFAGDRPGPRKRSNLLRARLHKIQDTSVAYLLAQQRRHSAKLLLIVSEMETTNIHRLCARDTEAVGS
jgi:hypothetical protein